MFASQNGSWRQSSEEEGIKKNRTNVFSLEKKYVFLVVFPSKRKMMGEKKQGRKANVVVTSDSCSKQFLNLQEYPLQHYGIENEEKKQ